MDYQKKAILIVDDEEDLTWSISRYFRRSDDLFETFCVSSGDQALEFMQKNHVDLLITDVKMPGISGLELVNIVLKKYPRMKVIMMTAYGSDEVQTRLDTAQPIFFVEKPFELLLLRETVYTALNIPEQNIRNSLLNTRIKEIIAFTCKAGKTSQLTFHRGISQGVVYFKQGEIVHAECGELEGENALFNILDWGKIDFFSSFDHRVSKRTIRRNWESLLNTAMID
ncbi:response regulator [candidate division KSB1 bacterium]|nr:response regulator [candidate division KSB1 bacterium]